MYDEIYDMNVSTDEDCKAAERTLKWMICCHIPLSIEILVKAVSYDSNGSLDEAVDADYLLAICSNFIIIDHNQMVQFAHLSVREYLVGGANHGYTTAGANYQAAKTSILYLINECSQGDSDPSKEDGFLQYAALHWPIHYSLALVDDDKGDTLKQLVDKFLSPSEPSDGFTTCLQIWADALPDIESLEMNLKIRASLNATKSPVFTACAWGVPGVIQKALSAGFNLDERNDPGDTALAVAAYFGQIEITRLLLDSGADVNSIGTEYGYTPLHHGSSAPLFDVSPLEVVQLLVQHGADVTKASQGTMNGQRTPLHLATYHENQDVLHFLLEKGARVNARDKEGLTALNSIFGENTEIARLLLEHGADPDLEDNNGQAPLQKAAANGRVEMVKLLLQHQDLGSEAEKWIRQAQFYNAVRDGDEATVELLLENGIDMTMKNLRGEYPLHWAMRGGSLRVASLLFQNGAGIDAADDYGCSALFVACHNTNEEMMKFLLDKGAEINMKERTGENKGQYNTVLSLATALGECQIVEMLLGRGASPQSAELDSLERYRGIPLKEFEKAREIVRSHMR